ncbi:MULTISPECIES: acyl carrier protein [Shewanella]|uniref:Acyl carrier protein n=1 Tax=Shewanella oncorhynchi TaxID=2726434 RepID=A0ABX1KKU6_9GAMM|nr:MULTISPECIES: acyl carrier protein [Shewanella]MCU8088324.1 acyl carrier protein [Shewanella sp. SM21]NLQ22811.1 acyl carrier protein [Shewanella oncorhynchi]
MSNVQKIIEIIADILETDAAELTIETELDETVWDSLAVVTFISEIDSNFDQIISPAELSSVKTVADLISLVK